MCWLPFQFGNPSCVGGELIEALHHLWYLVSLTNWTYIVL